jgi:hypothetical protein
MKVFVLANIILCNVLFSNECFVNNLDYYGVYKKDRQDSIISYKTNGINKKIWRYDGDGHPIKLVETISGKTNEFDLLYNKITNSLEYKLNGLLVLKVHYKEGELIDSIEFFNGSVEQKRKTNIFEYGKGYRVYNEIQNGKIIIKDSVLFTNEGKIDISIEGPEEFIIDCSTIGDKCNCLDQSSSGTNNYEYYTTDGKIDSLFWEGIGDKKIYYWTITSSSNIKITKTQSMIKNKNNSFYINGKIFRNRYNNDEISNKKNIYKNQVLLNTN